MSRNFQKYLNSYLQLPYEHIQETLRRRTLLNLLEKHKGKRFVEVGCGRESIFKSFTDVEHGVVVEPIHDLLLLNSELFSSGGRVIGVNLSAQEFAARNDVPFEVCILSSVLHEMEDPTDLLDACRSLLIQDGYLILNVPNAYSLHRLLGVALGLLPTVHHQSNTQVEMQQLQNVFDKHSLRALLISSGFEVTEIFTALLKFLPHEALAELLRHGVIELTTISELEKFLSAVPEFGSEIFCEARLKLV